MASKDSSPPHNPISEYAVEPKQSGIGKARNGVAVWRLVVKTSILLVMVTAIGIAITSVENPVAPLTDITASLLDKSVLQPGTDEPMPTIQPTASAHDLPPAPGDAPAYAEILAAPEATDQSQIEITQPPTEALLEQFQSWVAEDDTRVHVGPVLPVQDAPILVVRDEAAGIRPVKKQPRFWSVKNARAEIRSERNPQTQVRPKHNPRPKVRREVQNVPAQVPPVPGARAKDQSESNAPAPGLLQSFGWRN